ncbi:MAG: ABC transporter permease, partial [Rhodopila sp.]|nr:ABC transporter permease [Rhodopila sp.]
MYLTGDWIARETGIRSAGDVQAILDAAHASALRIEVSRLGEWDSAFIAFLKLLHESARSGGTQAVQLDL